MARWLTEANWSQFTIYSMRLKIEGTASGVGDSIAVSARRKITKFESLLMRKSDGLFGLTQHFPNIKNVYLYIQRGYDDSQILIIGIC